MPKIIKNGIEYNGWKIDNGNNMISDVWNPSTNYTLGKYAIDGNKLYRCIVANTNMQPGTNPTYWSETSVGNEINSINNSLIVESVMISGSCNATSYATFTASVLKDGYIPIGVVGFAPTTGDYARLNTFRMFISGTTLTMSVYNIASSAATFIYYVYILYCKD